VYRWVEAGWLGVAAAWICLSGLAQAGGLDTYAAFNAATLDRQIHGRDQAVDLGVGSLDLGRTTAFFGMDSLSDANNRYLTSGLRWQSRDQGASPFTLGVTNTVARGARIGSQTLMQAELRLQSAGLWYLPGLTLEADRLSSHGAAHDFGQALVFGLGRQFARGQYHIGYARMGPYYHPWGSSLDAGGGGLTLSGRYAFNDRWRLDNTLRLGRGAIASVTGSGILDKWQLSGGADDPAGRPWHLAGQFGSRAAATGGAAPFAVELASGTQAWHRCRIGAALGWYQGAVELPLDVPVAGGLWRVSARHDFDLAGLETCFVPSFAVGGSRYANQSWGSRAGLSLNFPELLDEVSVGVDYLSPGWGAQPSHSNLRMMLNITENAGALLPWLDALAGRLGGAWLGR
jgi:hypothetical protein